MLSELGTCGVRRHTALRLEEVNAFGIRQSQYYVHAVVGISFSIDLLIVKGDSKTHMQAANVSKYTVAPSQEQKPQLLSAAMVR